MAEFTDSIQVVAEAYEALLRTAQEELGLADVFYGDQTIIPRTPTACVVPGAKRREWRTSPRGMLNTFPVEVIVYHYVLTDGVQANSREVTALAEAIETLFHKVENKSLGGLVVHQFVHTVEPRYTTRGSDQFKVTRLVAEATNQTMLPYQ